MEDLFNGRLANRHPSWRDLGSEVDKDTSVVTALKNAGLDYQVSLAPITVEAFGHSIETPRVAIVREPDGDSGPSILGYASKNYQVIQNREFAAAIDTVVEKSGWPVDTVGTGTDGQSLLVTLRGQTLDIEGDPVESNFLFFERRDGGTATKVAIVPMRIYCSNMLVWALNSSTIKAAIQHQGDMNGEVAFNLDLVGQMQRAQEEMQAAMRTLAKAKFTKNQIERVFARAYPEPRETAGVRRARSLVDSTFEMDEARRQKFAEDIKRHDDWTRTVATWKAGAQERLVAFNDEYPQLSETAWAVVNAIAETEQYRRGRDPRSVAESVLFGERGTAINAGFQVAYGIALEKQAKSKN